MEQTETAASFADDEPCTIIEPNETGRTLAVYAAKVTGEYVQFKKSWISGQRYSRKLDAEGIEWIRGHHAPDSPEVLALLAAGALATEQPPPPLMSGSWTYQSNMLGSGYNLSISQGLYKPGHFNTTPKP